MPVNENYNILCILAFLPIAITGLECFTSNVNFSLDEKRIGESKLVNCSSGTLACFISSKKTEGTFQTCSSAKIPYKGCEVDQQLTKTCYCTEDM